MALSYKVFPGTPYYSNTSLTTQAGEIVNTIAATYVNTTYGTVSIGGVTYYVAYGQMVSFWNSSFTGPQIDDAVSKVRNPDTTVTPSSAALITSGAVAAALEGIDPTITSNTATDLTGLIKGNGSKVSVAVAGTDYQAPLIAGTDYATPASVTAKADKTDLTSIIATGSTNATGAKIDAGTFFYLNGTLVQAKVDIATGATFTSGTNYESPTAGALNALNSALMGKPNYSAASVLDENVSSFEWVADEDCYLFVAFRNLTGNAVGTAYIIDANGNAWIYCGTFAIDQSVVGNYQQDTRYFVLPKGYGLRFTVTSGQIRMVTKVPCK